MHLPAPNLSVSAAPPFSRDGRRAYRQDAGRARRGAASPPAGRSCDDGDMSLQEWRRAQGTSFGAAADIYERGRPPYPARAIDWLVPAHAGRVVDLGAGTGKLTRQLSERGLGVIAGAPATGVRDQVQ